MVIIGIIFLTIIFAGWYFDRHIKIARYRINSPKIGKEPFIIVMFGDLHDRVTKNRQQELLDIIYAQKPDLVMLAGDFFDEKGGISGTELLLDGLKNVPVYYVTGNHEYLSRNVIQKFTVLQKKGALILNDEYSLFTKQKGSLVVGGINDDEAVRQGYKIKSHSELLQIFKNVKESQYFSVLIAHKPEQIKRFSQYGFDLVVSGHTHGGQVRIPYLLNGLYCANQGFFPHRAGGRYDDYGVIQIVNRGISNPYPMLPRYFNSPEISVLEIANMNS
jgi:predicted MPP superfamily phosphohydrolase